MEGGGEEELTLDLDYITVEWDASISFAPLVHVVTSGGGGGRAIHNTMYIVGLPLVWKWKKKADMRRRSDMQLLGLPVTSTIRGLISIRDRGPTESLWSFFGRPSILYTSSGYFIFHFCGQAGSYCVPGCGHWQANFPHAAPLYKVHQNRPKIKNKKYSRLCCSGFSFIEIRSPVYHVMGFSEFPAQRRLLYPLTHIKCSRPTQISLLSS
jgi:hypothetical protein